MDPDDSYSPPLDGLSRGHKLHQVLTTLSGADTIHDTKYRPEDDGGPELFGILSVDEMIETDEETGAVGLLVCNWWHMSLEPDWWKYEYFESIPDSEVEPVEGSDEGKSEVRFPMLYHCGWYQQENEQVDGLAYYREYTDDGFLHKPFEPKFDAPKPLTRAIIDHYLPQHLRVRHQDV